MLRYKNLKQRPMRLLALTGLARREFEELLPAFDRAYVAHYPMVKKKRKRAAGGGRKATLQTREDQLLFILVYQKTYPLQVVMAELFEFSQPSANYWIHHLLPVLLDALAALKVLPERNGERLADYERRQQEPPDLVIDGTERRRQRPKNPEKQALHYSGKKKAHSDKNVVIVHTASKRVAFLSTTYAGKTHDKKVADQEQIRYPHWCILRQDTGFQGYQPRVARLYQPKKSRGAVS
jgi:DDE superfamily endonuclease/Helix-turn-helix of DDE superfamily endonuclease